MAFFQTATVYPSSRLSAAWFNTYIRNPLLYLKGKFGTVQIQDSLKIVPNIGKTAFFQLPQVTTAQRLTMFHVGTDARSAKLVYDRDLHEVWMWHNRQWDAVAGANTLGDILNARTTETDGFKRLAPKGANSELEWVYNRAEFKEFTVPTGGSSTYIPFDLPNWATMLAVTMLGGGGAGGAGNVATGTSASASQQGCGGSGGTRGQYRSRFVYAYSMPSRVYVRVGAGGTGGTSAGAGGTGGGTSGVYYPHINNFSAPGTAWSTTGGGNPGYGGKVSGANLRSLQYSVSGAGSGYWNRTFLITPGVNAAGGGGGGFWSTGNTFFARPGGPGGNALYRYDYDRATTGGGAEGASGVDGADGADGVVATDSLFFGSGGAGGGGTGGAISPGTSTVPANGSNGGNGGNGIQGSGGGGGGGCVLGGTPGNGGNGGNGIVRITWW